MMNSEFLENQADKLFEQFEGKLNSSTEAERYAAATPEERKKADEIKNTIDKYMKNKDYEGLKRYLLHTKEQL